MATQDILNINSQSIHIRNAVFAIANQWFANRNPLTTRIPHVPVGSTTFKIVTRNFRPRAYTLGAAIADGVVTTITLNDATPLMAGDVLELISGERVEVATVDSGTTVTVIRGVESTTGAAQANGTAVYLIGNSRTGAEVDQIAAAMGSTGVDQYCQTFQHPVQVGGSLQAETEYVAAGPARTPFDQFKMDALQNLMDDMEYSTYYGKGQAPSAGGRQKQKGLRALVGNLVTTPTNAGAYKATDFVRDALQSARQNGGQPDTVFMSSNFMTGLATWGHQVQRVDAGKNMFGTPIDLFHAPFLTGVNIIEAPLLKPFTAVAVTSSEVRMRMKREVFWNPRGVRGDAYEGDWMAEGAIELDNPGHHAWVEGITAFAA